MKLKYPLELSNKTGKEILLDTINKQNNLNLKANRILIDETTMTTDSKGLTRINIQDPKSSSVGTIQYFKQDIGLLNNHHTLILPLNLKETTKENIAKTIEEKYNIFLEPGTFTIEDTKPKRGPTRLIEKHTHLREDKKGNLILTIRHQGEPNSVKVSYQTEECNDKVELPWFRLHPSRKNPWCRLSNKYRICKEGVSASYYKNKYADYGRWIFKIEKGGKFYTKIKDISIQEPIFYITLADRDNVNTKTHKVVLTQYPEDYIHHPETLANKILKVKITKDNLIYKGELPVRCVGKIDFGKTSISKYLELEYFFSDKRNNKYPFSNLQRFKLLVDDPNVGIELLKQTKKDLNLPLIRQLLETLTKDEWIMEPKDNNFNLYNLELIYNGRPSSDHPPVDDAYDNVIVFRLSDYCRNLMGLIRIGYRTDTKSTITHYAGSYERPLPIFNRK